jgi:molybdopterin converting factor small subunit
MGNVPPPKMLRVLLLGPLRLALQTEEYCLPCPVDGSQETFWNSLFERFPSLSDSRAAIRLVRNDRFLLPEDRLEPGDEVALIPPVSGG